MKSLNLTVLLFCLVTYGYGRPSDTEERDDIIREAKREKYFQQDNTSELPEHETESPALENVLKRLKSIAHLRTAETRKPTTDHVTREELEALKDLLDKNLQKYQNYNEYSFRKRPNDPYIGQILQNLNAEHLSDSVGNNNNNNNNKFSEQNQMPIRRKIIRRTVIATPLSGSIGAVGNGGNPNSNRVYNNDGDGVSSRWSPWADYFPILINDPFQTMMNSFSEIIEYGPAADICRHAAASQADTDANRLDGGGAREARGPETARRARRNAPSATAAEEEKGVLNHIRPFKPHATTTTTERPKLYHWAPDKPASEHNGDMGPQIKRLVVRRGGVAIAGPGGIATAGSGGTAIVGPGGSAYSSKDSASGASSDVPLTGGVSMAGYGPHAVQGPSGYFAGYPPFPVPPQPHNGYGRSADGGTAVLSSDGVAYTFPEPSRGLTVTAGGRPRNGRDGDWPSSSSPLPSVVGREISLPDGAKIIATGPIVYYNPEPSSRSTSSAHRRKRSRDAKKPKSDDRPNDESRGTADLPL